MASPYTLKWGIMATGLIANQFAQDLLCNPETRDVHDVRHEIAAVASSSSKKRAEAFLEEIKAGSTTSAAAKAYGSYAELVADGSVDIIYVATPHSHHFQNSMLALEAGKHVLCEKALTMTAAQARKLVQTARDRGLFFMEAVWTRFFPLSIKVRELIAAGEIGTVYRTIADFSINSNADDSQLLRWPDSHRMVDRSLAGGATLDLGIYALTWVFQALYHVQPSAAKETPRVTAVSNNYAATGCDENTVIICQFPQHNTLGVATTTMRAATDPEGHHASPAARIQGSRGEIQVMYPTYRPESIKVIRKTPGAANTLEGGHDDVSVMRFPIPRDDARDGFGRGMFWQADECARCLRDGKVQSATMPWEESVVMMEVMEEALRQGGVEYPEEITTDVYDAKSPLNVGNQ